MRMQAEPGLRLKACQVEFSAQFGKRRDIGQIGQPSARCHSKCYHIAILDLRQGRRKIINQAIQNYANQQQAPMQAYNQYNALLRGYAVPGMTTTQYQAAPSMTSQIAGLGTAAAGAYGLMKKKGGAIKEKSGRGIDSLGLRNALNARAR